MKKILLIFAVPFVLYGCAGKLMQKIDKPTDIKFNNGQSALIFIRSSGSHSAPIAEYKDKDVSFVGNSTGGSVIMHITNAGKHEYIIAAGRGTVCKADLKSGMFYYIYILPKNQNGKNILYCESYETGKKKSIKLHGGDYIKYIDEYSVKNDLKYTIWQDNTAEGFTWFEYNKPSFIKKYNYALQTENIYEIKAETGVPALIK